MQTERIAINDRNACTGLISARIFYLDDRPSESHLLRTTLRFYTDRILLLLRWKNRMVLLIGVNEHGKRVREKKWEIK